MAQEKLLDVANYKWQKFVGVAKISYIDNTDDFILFATDHYGEQDFWCLNIFVSNKRLLGWKIVVPNSYFANARLAIEVATVLYKAGAPLLVYDVIYEAESS